MATFVGIASDESSAAFRMSFLRIRFSVINLITDDEFTQSHSRAAWANIELQELAPGSGAPLSDE